MFVSSITRVSVTQADVQPNNTVYSASLSPDGTKVAFVSDASNLVAGDTNGTDVFVKDLVTGEITRISTDANGAEGNNAGVLMDRLSPPQFSPDGTKVLFVSSSSNLVADDTFNVYDAFLKTISGPNAGAIEMVSRYGDGSSIRAFNSVYFAALSPDGTKVLLATNADLANGAAGNPLQLSGLPLFLRDLATGQSKLVSADAAGVSSDVFNTVGSVSPDGTLVVFPSSSSDLVSSDTNNAADVFLKNAVTGAISRVTTDAAGGQTQGLPNGGGTNTAPAFSPDGTKILFHSAAADLVGGDSNGVADLFIKTISGPNAGKIERVSTSASGAQANGASVGPASFSPDGTKIVFVSSASNLVAGDTNNAADVFVKSLLTGEVVLIGGPGGLIGNGAGSNPSFSADGRSVLFLSTSTNLVAGDTNGLADIFLARLEDPPPSTTPPTAPPTSAPLWAPTSPASCATRPIRARPCRRR